MKKSVCLASHKSANQQEMKISDIYFLNISNQENVKPNYIRENKNSFVANSFITLVLLITAIIIVNCEETSNSLSTFKSAILEIALGNQTTIKESVPFFSNVHIKCKIENATWFKNDKILKKEEGSMTMKLYNIGEKDSGNYSCFSKSFDSWANLTLKIQSDSWITDTDYLDQNKNNDMDLEDGSKDIYSADMQTIPFSSEEHAPSFKNFQKLFNLLSKPSGSFIQLPCPANGNPTPNISWTKDGEKISRTMGKVSYKKWSINMEDLIPEDSGVYTCKVCNPHGCIEHSARLIINDRLRSRPILSEGYPQNQTAIENSTVYLECKVISDLEPHIVWVTYQKNIQKNEIEKLVLNLSNSVSHNFASDHPMFRKLKTDPEKTDVLRLENVTHEDEGWYTCIAANSLGQSTSSAYLQVIGEFPKGDEPVSLLIRDQPIGVLVLATVIFLLFLVGAIFIIYVLRKLKHEKLLKHRIETVHQWTKKVIIYKPTPDSSSSETMVMPIVKIEKQRTTVLQSSNADPAPFNEYEFPLDTNWEIPRNKLVLGAILGEGAFGRVVMAEVNGLAKCFSTSIVAVKMVKEGHTDSDMASLVREMEVMKMIGKHINIINLLGCCSQEGPLYVIVEFAPYGNLKDFLKKNRPPSFERMITDNFEKQEILTEKNLVSFAFQVARGMEYLASRRCIHRDLAARNVLVSDNFIIKIADFGLARDIQDTDYYRKNTNGRLPIKWMAPESLQEKFYDTQSDVWSYGVLLWEIMTYGEQPYPQIMSAEELYLYLKTGQRMEKPQKCSLNVYMLMRQCWNFDADARPTFSEIVENLDIILLANTNANEEYLDLTLPLLETPPSSSENESDTETLHETSVLRYHCK